MIRQHSLRKISGTTRSHPKPHNPQPSLSDEEVIPDRIVGPVKLAEPLPLTAQYTQRTVSTRHGRSFSTFSVFLSDKGLFLGALDRNLHGRARSSTGKVTGITVPHHLLARDLIADAFKAAASPSVTRVIIVGPDHFFGDRVLFLLRLGIFIPRSGFFPTIKTRYVNSLPRLMSRTGIFLPRTWHWGTHALCPFSVSQCPSRSDRD